jgi:hypothetical protein
LMPMPVHEGPSGPFRSATFRDFAEERA